MLKEVRLPFSRASPHKPHPTSKPGQGKRGGLHKSSIEVKSNNSSHWADAASSGGSCGCRELLLVMGMGLLWVGIVTCIVWVFMGHVAASANPALAEVERAYSELSLQGISGREHLDKMVDDLHYFRSGAHSAGHLGLLGTAHQSVELRRNTRGGESGLKRTPADKKKYSVSLTVDRIEEMEHVLTSLTPLLSSHYHLYIFLTCRNVPEFENFHARAKEVEELPYIKSILRKDVRVTIEAVGVAAIVEHHIGKGRHSLSNPEFWLRFQEEKILLISPKTIFCNNSFSATAISPDISQTIPSRSNPSSPTNHYDMEKDYPKPLREKGKTAHEKKATTYATKVLDYYMDQYDFISARSDQTLSVHGHSTVVGTSSLSVRSRSMMVFCLLQPSTPSAKVNALIYHRDDNLISFCAQKYDKLFKSPATQWHDLFAISASPVDTPTFALTDICSTNPCEKGTEEILKWRAMMERCPGSEWIPRLHNDGLASGKPVAAGDAVHKGRESSTSGTQANVAKTSDINAIQEQRTLRLNTGKSLMSLEEPQVGYSHVSSLDKMISNMRNKNENSQSRKRAMLQRRNTRAGALDKPGMTHLSLPADKPPRTCECLLTKW